MDVDDILRQGNACVLVLGRPVGGGEGGRVGGSGRWELCYAYAKTKIDVLY